MKKAQSTVLTATLALTLVLALHIDVAGVDVRVDFEKTFDFKSARTWAWNPEGAGQVKMARTREDDPEAMKTFAEPIILDAVKTETARRGLQPATGDPDLTLTYFLLLTTNTSAQTVGQFLPATTMWGLPPFPQATQSLEMMNRGALVLDFMSKGTIVWRGVGQADIKFGIDSKKREALLREGVRDLLRRYPPKI